MLKSLVLASAGALSLALATSAPTLAGPAGERGVRTAAAPTCVAVALTRGGRGARVPNTRSVARGPRPCVRAMRGCRIQLARRKARGLNPYASCVVVRRFRG